MEADQSISMLIDSHWFHVISVPNFMELSSYCINAAAVKLTAITIPFWTSRFVPYEAGSMKAGVFALINLLGVGL